MHNETGPQDTEIKGIKGGRQTELGFEEQDIRAERKGEGGWQMHERLLTELLLLVELLGHTIVVNLWSVTLLNLIRKVRFSFGQPTS
jgi:hypothetical protein